MKVYVASSWRNEQQPAIVEVLRADGHEVYDYRHPEPGNDGFGWRQIGDRSAWNAEHFATHVLDHPVAERGFEFDMRALEAASACVLVLPCGRSAHLELGYAVGQGKLTVVYMPFLDEPELMYRMCDYVVTRVDDVRVALTRARLPPRWQRDLREYDARGLRGKRYESTLPCNDVLGGPCREFSHRECAVCGGCWRHGACECSPEQIERMA